MDNRRVIKAYKQKGRENFLPLPSKAGLLSKMKRYISGSSLWQDSSRSASASSSRVSSRTASRQPSVSQPNAHSSRLLSESFALAANQSVEQNPDQTANEVLSTFFKEKGDRPLSQIEYEGVMSLLEKSRANITLQPDDSAQINHTVSHPRSPTRESSFAQHNTTFSTQRVLKNTSMYEGHNAGNATFSADYKPQYQSVNTSTRAAPAVKRVYQFSGLPSPYRTRIRTPSQPHTKARRIATESAVSETPSSTLSIEPEASKPRSNTANSLLSVLDNHQKKESTDVAVGTTDRPLHNPYAKNKRRTARTGGSAPAPFTTADDISKTIAFNKAEKLAESPEKSKEDTLFSSPAKDETKTKVTENGTENGKKIPQPSFTFKPTDTKPAEDKPAFSFNLKGSTDEKAAPKAQPKPDANGFLFDSQKPSFSFSAKPESKDEVESKPKFGFNPPKASEFKPREDVEKDETFASPAFSSDTKAKSDEAKTPAFSFGAKSQESSTNDKPFSLFGNSGDNKGGASLLFGKSSNGEKKVDTDEKAQEQPTASLFGSTSTTSKSAPRAAPPRPVFNVGAKAAEEEPAEEVVSDDKEEPAKPAFSFGAKSSAPAFAFPQATNKENAKPSFAFGGSSTQEAGDEKKDEKPAFNFGSSTETKPSTGFNLPKTTTAPAFNFGSTKTDTASSLNFGKSGDKPASAFNFGSANDKSEKPSENATPAFTFGKKDAEKSSSLFGSSADNGKTPTPSFNFSSSSNTEKPSLFGSSAESQKPPLFGFGKTAENKTSTDDESSKDEKKPSAGFSFGSTNKSKAAPVFDFGKAVEKPTASTSLFGRTDTTKDKPFASFGTSSTASATPLAFGSSSEKSATPSFNFGSTEGAKPAPAFGFNKPAEKPAASTNLSESSESKLPASFASKPAEQSLPAVTDSPSPAKENPFAFLSKSSKDKPAFNFGSSATPALGPQTTSGTETNSASDEFVFPKLQGTELTEEEKEQAKQYEDLYNF